MSSPIYAISLRRGEQRLDLYIRRSSIYPKKKPNNTWYRVMGGWDQGNVAMSVGSYCDYFPVKGKREWIVACFNGKKGGDFLQLRRVNQMNYERMTFNEAYELFMAHMRMFVTVERNES